MQSHQFIELCYATLLKLLNPRLKIIHQIHLLFEKRNLAFYLERFISQKVAKIVTVSNAAKAELCNTFGFDKNNISVLYNGIMEYPNTHPVNSHNLLVNPERFNIVMVANFVFGKDQETILRAYQDHIREKLPEVCIYFIGRESDLSDHLKSKYLVEQDFSTKRISFCGAIPNAGKLLNQFDLVVMSCFSETFNMALAEAVIAQRKVLASDIPVFRELSDNGKYFTHFKTGDANDFYLKLKAIAGPSETPVHPDITRQFKEKFSFDGFIINLTDLYQKVHTYSLDEYQKPAF
jgi:glycosyltransferase involved in cell wall biosynthesis